MDELGSYPFHKMEMFRTVIKENLLQIISQLNSSSGCLDSIPTVFLKKVLHILIDYVLDIVNNSLETGIFPNAFKKAVVKPLLKKPNLDYSLLNNYRPISNISLLSKILEKVVLQQLNQFLD